MYRLKKIYLSIQKSGCWGELLLHIYQTDTTTGNPGEELFLKHLVITKADVKKIVAVGKKHGIKIAPQINLLGHQSWAAKTNALLRVYPEFDETPHVDTKNYTGWPNAD